MALADTSARKYCWYFFYLLTILLDVADRNAFVLEPGVADNDTTGKVQNGYLKKVVPFP